MKINSISSTSKDFPERLRAIPQVPGRLYIRGELPEYRLGIAIVGTRKPTAYGRQITFELATRLTEKGAMIVSGLAHGIDGIAHEATVKAGGTGVVVLANGLDTVYPSTHARLADKLLACGGALVSEYEPGTPPLQFRFLERNRLVTGLSDKVIVTEAGLRSGTMNTVGHALEQGRDVYAVPGPITSAMSAGCNALIAQGATPIVSIDQFIEDLFPKTSKKQARLLAHTDEEQVILELLAGGIVDGDELQQKSALDGAVFAQTMTMLEIRGAIRALGANRWGL
ncbi:MAG TPA: DNA-processing protein DprA [Candidatus Saccharibacteria bacterium]|nr:DNA-processing protein DprA [Candidatus Saccharibacteria bacterium]